MAHASMSSSQDRLGKARTNVLVWWLSYAGIVAKRSLTERLFLDAPVWNLSNDFKLEI